MGSITESLLGLDPEEVRNALTSEEFVPHHVRLLRIRQLFQEPQTPNPNNTAQVKQRSEKETHRKSRVESRDIAISRSIAASLGINLEEAHLLNQTAGIKHITDVEGRFLKFENAQKILGSDLAVFRATESELSSYESELKAATNLLLELDPNRKLKEISVREAPERFGINAISDTVRKLIEFKGARDGLDQRYLSDPSWSAILHGISTAREYDSRVPIPRILERMTEASIPSSYAPKNLPSMLEKLSLLCGLETVDPLAKVKGLNLEVLRKRAKKGDDVHYSIRVNRTIRLVFRFENGAAQDVALTNYH